MQLGFLPTDDRASPASYIDYSTLLSFYQGENWHGIFTVLLVDLIMFENIHDLTSSNLLPIIYEL